MLIALIVVSLFAVAVLFYIRSCHTDLAELRHEINCHEVNIGMLDDRRRKITRELHEERTIVQRLRLTHQQDMEHLQDSLNDTKALLRAAHAELGQGTKLAAVKFKAHIPGMGLATTLFQIGEGPCGKTVKRLRLQEGDDKYTLWQYHTDGTHKTFEYPRADIVGRIEKLFV